jgi:hypothetical protein
MNAATYEAEVEDNYSDYSSGCGSAGPSRRDRAARRTDHLDALAEERRIKAAIDDAHKEYSQARPPAFNHNKSLDVWIHQFQSLLSTLPDGDALVNSFTLLVSSGTYTCDNSEQAYKIIIRSFDTSEEHVHATESAMVAADLWLTLVLKAV